jgi:hypothetical protein
LVSLFVYSLSHFSFALLVFVGLRGRVFIYGMDVGSRCLRWVDHLMCPKFPIFERLHNFVPKFRGWRPRIGDLGHGPMKLSERKIYRRKTKYDTY